MPKQGECILYYDIFLFYPVSSILCVVEKKKLSRYSLDNYKTLYSKSFKTSLTKSNFVSLCFLTRIILTLNEKISSVLVFERATNVSLSFHFIILTV
jgi:hypothetical protein